MYAPLPVSENQSRIAIRFGEKIVQQNSPIHFDLQLDFFSEKVCFTLKIPQNQNIRFNLQEMLDIKINDATLVLEIVAKNGNGSQLAEKTMNFLKNNEDYQSNNKSDQNLTIKAIGKGEICYFFINSRDLTKALSQVGLFIDKLQTSSPEIKKSHNLIKMQIKSLNSCDHVRKLLDNQGATRAYFDSLNIELKFEKTKLIESVLIEMFSNNEIKHLIGPLKACKKLNLNVNFASSSEQDRFQNLRVLIKNKGQKENFAFLKQIKGQYKDQIKLILIDPIFSIQGKLIAENAASLIDAFFE